MTEPAGKDEPANFLSRWSRRKVDAKAAPDAAAPEAAAMPAGGAVTSAPSAEAADSAPAEVLDTATPQPLPDLDTLANDGDFSPFMAKGVDAATRNQAMKKLFTDPHYGFDNMDKLDIYLDDYSKPDPIPLEMLRNLNQAKRLFLFDDEEKDAAEVPETPVSPVAPAALSVPEAGAVATGKDVVAGPPAAVGESPPLK